MATTPLYDKLNPEMQATVDSWVERLEPLAWSRRADLLAQAAQPYREEFPDEQARHLTRGFITAVLEKLDEDTITNPLQAVMHLLSLHPHHNAQAQGWLAEHEEMRQVVEEGLGQWE